MIKVGLCGAGFMGRMHGACLADIPGVKLTAVADARRSWAEAAAKPAGAKMYSTAAELIKKADVDMVHICMPTFLHAETVILAARRGLACFVEKPMTLKAAEGRRMLKAVRAAKIKFTVGHVIRFWPEYQALKKLVDTKRYGALRALFLKRVVGRPGGWKKWYHNPSFSGGAALDLHIHDVDYVQYLLGRPEELDSVGVGRKGSWDQIHTSYYYPGMAVTAIGGWWPAPEPFEMSFRAVFDKGIVSYGSRTLPLTLFAPGKAGVKLPLPKAPGAGNVNAGGNISSRGAYFNEDLYFVQCLQKGREPEIVTGEDGLAAVELVEREVASAAKKLRG